MSFYDGPLVERVGCYWFLS